MQVLRVSVIGNEPGMLQANVRAANPLDPMAKQLKAANATLKRNNTDENLQEKLNVEWLTLLYWDEGRGIHIPQKQIQGGLLKASRKYKQPGKMSNLAPVVASTLSPKGNAYIVLPGGEKHATQDDILKLRDDVHHRYDDLVSVGTATVLKSRPLIPAGWQAVLQFEYADDDPEAPGLDLLHQIMVTMGRGGFGDWRPNSPTPGVYGTFTIAKFEVSKDGKKFVEQTFE